MRVYEIFDRVNDAYKLYLLAKGIKNQRKTDRQRRNNFSKGNFNTQPTQQKPIVKRKYNQDFDNREPYDTREPHVDNRERYDTRERN